MLRINSPSKTNVWSGQVDEIGLIISFIEMMGILK